MLFTILQRKNNMNPLDKVLTEQLKKENMFVSKELSHLIETKETNYSNSTFWYNAVFNEFELPFEYINYKNQKNRDHLVGKCNCIVALKILQNSNPKYINLMFKDTVIKKIKLDDIIKQSIKCKSENSYIIKYSISKGENNAV